MGTEKAPRSSAPKAALTSKSAEVATERATSALRLAQEAASESRRQHD